ncbi:MAG: hypothetical protein CL808_08580 [Citromicrobium sp.]|nr:hypothetical protein [Citromicrobium sp.]
MRIPFLALVSGMAMLGATSCDAQAPLENWQKTQHFERAVSDVQLAGMLEQLSQQTITDMIFAPGGQGFSDEVADAGFTADESNALIRRAYAPYGLSISEYTHREISAELSQEDIDALFTAGTDPEAIKAVMCAYGRPAVDGDVDWDGCTAEGFVALPETFKQAHARYSAAYQAVVDGPRTQTYYGGVSCRVLDQVQARLTNEKHMIEFTGTKLGMSGQEKEPCDVLKARLDALDKAAAAQGS